LKGGVGALGAHATSELAQGVEHSCAKGNLAEAARILPALEAEMLRLCAFLASPDWRRSP
jgi:hypothetical protein